MNGLLNLNELETIPPKYIMGVDIIDSEILVYCLIKHMKEGYDIILSKQMTNKLEFEGEVNNLTKYFNADKIEWK